MREKRRRVVRSASGKVSGSLAELRRKGCRSNGGCAVVIAPATATTPDSVGNLMQSFRAAAYRGKTVRLRAWVRVEAGGPEDRAQMWLRVDRPNGKVGFLEDMDGRRCGLPNGRLRDGGGDWATRSLWMSE
jgi:hypothetical protein